MKRFVLALGATALLVTGCGSDAASDASGASASAPSIPPAATAPLPSDEQAGLQSILDSTRAEFGFPGAMVGLWTPEGSWFGTTGTSGPNTTEPPTRDDHTRIGSLTKTFTGMAILRLVDQQKLSLGDTIGTYVPNMPNGDTATLRDLMSMTSGIPSYTQDEAFANAWMVDPATTEFTPQQLVDFVAGEAPMFPAGSSVYYSNTNTVLLGMVIEKVTGQPVAQVFEQELLGPLGLSATSFPGTSPALPEPHLDGITDQPFDDVRDATDWNPSWAFTAGEMISQLDDLRTWTIVLGTGGGLISDDLQQQREASTTSTVPPNDPDLTYGLGFFANKGWWGHNGSLPGYTSFAAYNPTTETSMVVLANSDIKNGEPPKAPADEIAHRVMELLARG